MKKHLPVLIGMLFLSTFGIGPDFVSGQEEEPTVTCPPNSHWSGQGSECACDAGFVVPRGENRCVPESQACRQFGPAHLVGNDCVCNEGYVIPSGGSRCEPVSATCPPNSHPEGASCFCDEGYGNIGGKCVSLAATCAKFNARWSPAKGDCECPPGLHEDPAANKCVPDAPVPETAASKPAQRPAAIRSTEPGQEKPGTPGGERGGGLSPGTQADSPPLDEPLSTRAEPPGSEAKSSLPSRPLPQEPVQPPAGAAGTAQEKQPSPGEEKDPKDTPSSDWWTGSEQNGGTASGKTVRNEVNTRTPGKAGQQEQAGAQESGASWQQTRPQLPPASEKDAREKMVPAGQAPANEENTAPDIYFNISTADSPPLEKVIAQNLQAASPENRRTLEDQLQTLSEFSTSGEREISLQSQGIIETAKEMYTSREYAKEAVQWHKEIQEAKEMGKVKKGADKDAYLARAADEKNLAAQIAELEKIIGFNHLRLVEAAGVLKHETMPAEYREHFSKSASDDFNAASEAIESNKAFANIKGAVPQLRELKDEFKRKYPKGWESNYLDLPERPKIETLRKKVENNIFILFEKKMSHP